MYLGIRLYIAFFMTFFGLNLHSQGLSHQVIVPAAGLQNTGSIHYAQTSGETAVEIFNCQKYVFTQGFQQPAISFKSELPPPGTGLKVYPNPVTDFVTVEFFGTEKRTFIIDFFSISGNILLSEKIGFDSNYWYCKPYSVERISRGLFFIRVMSTDGIINRTFKIERL